MPREKQENMRYPNRLRELIEKHFSDSKTLQKKMERFSAENSIAYDTVKRYVYETANIPSERAAEFAEKYGVTVEWLMDRPLNGYDVTEILTALSAVLRVASKKEPFYRGRKVKGHIVRTLYMDEKFYAFLSKVQELQYQRKTDISLDDETFARRMDKIFSHYKDYFEVKFKTNHFDIASAFEIENLELF